MQALGIDMGTTTISLVMVDRERGSLLGSRTFPHEGFLEGFPSFCRVQDPETLFERAMEGLREMIRSYGPPDCIGMTGQMHGMLYVDGRGMAVSPLYTWQDGCGSQLLPEGRTSGEILNEAAPMAASGYGLTTHYYLTRMGQVPPEAKGMTTISDYVAMRLCGRAEPLLAPDMAASWGCYDMERGDFRREALEGLGLDLSLLPALSREYEAVGKTRADLTGIPGGIPVTASLGDNQASVVGSLRDMEGSVLLNIGTGSQVSVVAGKGLSSWGSLETRPCPGGRVLLVGSGLCGGRAYAMLEEFYREVTGEDKELYDQMEKQAREFLGRYGREGAWRIRTTFSGTRSDPSMRGQIQGIGVENFHPGAMTAGMLLGILEELYAMYEKMCQMTGKKARILVGSGNGFRKNPLLRELAKELFQMPVAVPLCREEAAYGAAIQSLASLGFVSSLKEMQEKIAYRQQP